MSIIEQLGLNHTYFIQLGLFVFTLIVLSQFVFKDFEALLDRRHEQTKGGENLAVETQKQSAELHGSYELKARQLNEQIKTIFDSYRQEAAAECEKIISQARSQSVKSIEETRQRMSVEIGDAARKLKEEAPLVAQTIASKLLGKTSHGKGA